MLLSNVAGGVRVQIRVLGVLGAYLPVHCCHWGVEIGGGKWASKTKSTVDDSLIPLARKFTKLVFMIFGILIVSEADASPIVMVLPVFFLIVLTFIVETILLYLQPCSIKFIPFVIFSTFNFTTAIIRYRNWGFPLTSFFI